jgi:hypothetical protein
VTGRLGAIGRRVTHGCESGSGRRDESVVAACRSRKPMGSPAGGGSSRRTPWAAASRRRRAIAARTSPPPRAPGPRSAARTVLALVQGARHRPIHDDVDTKVRLTAAAEETRRGALGDQQLVAQALEAGAFELRIGQVRQAVAGRVGVETRLERVEPAPSLIGGQGCDGGVHGKGRSLGPGGGVRLV